MTPPPTALSAANPTGIITFLFTDIEGSTRLWETFPAEMPHAFARHEAIVRETVAVYGGHAYKMIGDAFQVAFQEASNAVACAADIQRALYREKWGDIGILKVRMGLHSGTVEERDEDYVGPLLNRVARLMAAGHGGQVLLSELTADLVRGTLSGGLQLKYLGYHRLKSLAQPDRIAQLTILALDRLAVCIGCVNSSKERNHGTPLTATALVGVADRRADARPGPHNLASCSHA